MPYPQTRLRPGPFGSVEAGVGVTPAGRPGPDLVDGSMAALCRQPRARRPSSAR